MEVIPPSARTWVPKKFNTTFPNLFTLYQKPAPAEATDSPYINLNLFFPFLLALKLSGIYPATAIATGPT